MLKRYLVLLCCSWGWWLPGSAQHCAADLFLQMRLSANPYLQEQQAAIDARIQQWIDNKTLRPRAVVTIPVVVHVVWREAIENISDEQVQSQIEVLNRDFRARNPEIATVPAIFRPVIADVEIEFCLAMTAPDGSLTTGITRRQTEVTQIGSRFLQGRRAICYTDLGGQDAWDTEHYLNIWIGKSTPLFIGEASFPGMDPPGEDGVRIDPVYFGTTGTVLPPYHLGRTVTHEIGHYFNLLHPWGMRFDSASCDQDDGINDTPRQSSTFRGECPVHPQIFCGTASMFMNFMNYTDDACMAMFTNGQKMRMLAALQLFRSGLMDAAGCQPPVSSQSAAPIAQAIRLSQNPVHRALQLQSAKTFSNPLRVRLLNVQGQELFSGVWQTGAIWNLDVSRFPAGLYVVVIQDREAIHTEKVVIR